MQNIGFVGLGNMGFPMAKNLIEAGYRVIGNDVNEERLEALHHEGAEKGNSFSEMVKYCDVVFTSLPSVEAYESVYLGADGLIHNALPNVVLVDLSTVAKENNIKVEKKANEHQVPFLQAPVSGGVVGAENKTLTFMIGGKTETVEKIRPIVNSLGENIFHVDERIESGTLVKLLNNLLIGFYTAGVSEALTLAEKQNIELDRLFDILSVSYGQSRIYERNYGSFISNNNYNPGFTLDLLIKDLKFVKETLDHENIDLPTTNHLLDTYHAAQESGFGQEDMSAFYKYIKNQKFVHHTN